MEDQHTWCANVHMVQVHSLRVLDGHSHGPAIDILQVPVVRLLHSLRSVTCATQCSFGGFPPCVLVMQCSICIAGLVC